MGKTKVMVSGPKLDILKTLVKIHVMCAEKVLALTAFSAMDARIGCTTSLAQR